mgnify:CR=1 FL=1
MSVTGPATIMRGEIAASAEVVRGLIDDRARLDSVKAQMEDALKLRTAGGKMALGKYAWGPSSDKGDTVEAMVLGVDPAARRISLGLKQVESNPWHELSEKYPVGTKIKGKVRNLTEFGAFVEVEEDIDGLIHISDMSWSKRIKHPSEVLKKGDVVDAMVLNIDAENQRLSLGLKQLATDIWDDFFSRHQVGSTIEGKVVRMTNFGAFVELDEGIEGLIHVSEFDDSRHAAKDEEKIELKVGESYQMKIIKLSPEERKIGLSIRALKSDEDRKSTRLNSSHIPLSRMPSSA